MVALYRALPAECGTASVAAALQAQGCEVCYPAVVPGERALQFRRASGVFVAGALGVRGAGTTRSPICSRTPGAGRLLYPERSRDEDAGRPAELQRPRSPGTTAG